MCYHIMPVSICTGCSQPSLVPETRLKICQAASVRGSSCLINPSDPPQFIIREGGDNCALCQPEPLPVLTPTATTEAPPPYEPLDQALDEDLELAYALHLSEVEEQSRREAAVQQIANELVNIIVEGINQPTQPPQPTQPAPPAPAVDAAVPVPTPAPVKKPKKKPAKAKEREIKQCPSFWPYMSKKDKFTTINGQKCFVR